jgi:hypothetical protein
MRVIPSPCSCSAHRTRLLLRATLCQVTEQRPLPFTHHPPVHRSRLARRPTVRHLPSSSSRRRISIAMVTDGLGALDSGMREKQKQG